MRTLIIVRKLIISIDTEKNVEANKIYYVKDNPILDRLLTILKKRYSDIEYRGIVINKKVYPNIVKRNENYCKNIITKYLKC